MNTKVKGGMVACHPFFIKGGMENEDYKSKRY